MGTWARYYNCNKYERKKKKDEEEEREEGVNQYVDR